MTPENAEWMADIVSFLASNTQRDGDLNSWDHSFTSAYQMSCDALVALGQAKATDWGAIALDPPEVPQDLPRWDDLCIVVLNLGIQRSQLIFLPQADEKQVPAVNKIPNVAPSNQTSLTDSPNIKAANELGAASAHPNLLRILDKLGLVKNQKWTPDATLVLWREQPKEWNMQVTQDARFKEAVKIATEHVPSDILALLKKLTTIKDLEEQQARERKERELLRKEFGQWLRRSKWRNDQTDRKSLVARRVSELDYLFFQRWRLSDGWLTEHQAQSALEIFHDPLATQMRQAVVRELYPDRPEYAI